jgi:hypothetical protein
MGFYFPGITCSDTLGIAADYFNCHLALRCLTAAAARQSVIVGTKQAKLITKSVGTISLNRGNEFGRNFAARNQQRKLSAVWSSQASRRLRRAL